MDKFDLILKIALGIKKMHDIGIGHYDIKLENILMFDKKTPRIADLGFS